MKIRYAASGAAIALLACALTGCSTQPTTCTLNSVSFSPTPVKVRGVMARAMFADMSVSHLGASRLRGPSLDVYDLDAKRDLGGPPVGSTGGVYLSEGRHVRLTLKMALADGKLLNCGVKTVTVPFSKGGMVATPSPTTSAL